MPPNMPPNKPQPESTAPSEPTAQSVYELRRATLERLRQAGTDPYPATAERTHTLSELKAQFKPLAQASTSLSVVGRLITLRQHGKISFGTLRDGSGDFQVAWQQDVLGDTYGGLENLDLGDFLECRGTLFTTKKGEPTLSLTGFRLLTKSLRPLPEKWHGLKDPEARYRQRYLDMLANPEVKDKLIVRSKLVTAIRRFLDQAGFLEIENPMLEVKASGAAAKPMQTHLDAYDLDLFLRISIGELWQKRSLIGGFEKIYEIGRAFRNEGVDYAHNPDFTMLEYYWAYADYQANLEFHEQLLPAVVKEAVGTLVVEHDGEEVDFTPPYPRITFREAIKQASGIDVAAHADAQSLAAAMKDGGYEVDQAASYRKLLDDLFKDSFRKTAVQPVFVTELPLVLSPLAKQTAPTDGSGPGGSDDPASSGGQPGSYQTTQRFQLVVATFELSNSFSELNDPIDQRQRFEEQAKLAAAGDVEAMPIDDDFVEALEYGMPPATGTGIGIDRFAALLTNSHSIREVTAYPLMKPKGEANG